MCSGNAADGALCLGDARHGDAGGRACRSHFQKAAARRCFVSGWRVHDTPPLVNLSLVDHSIEFADLAIE
jgi:hypothetical protein